MELLPQPVGSAPELDLQLVFKPGELSQSKHLRAVYLHTFVAVPVGPQRCGQDQRISRIVLRACHSETVAKSINVSEIDRKQAEAMLDKSFYECTPGDFDADSYQTRVTRGSLFKFVNQGDEALAALGRVVLLYDAPVFP